MGGYLLFGGGEIPEGAVELVDFGTLAGFGFPHFINLFLFYPT